MDGKPSPDNEEEIKKLNLPAGYMFRPTSAELVAGHLIPKLVLVAVGFKRQNAGIMDLNVYDYDPDQLPFNKFKYVVENEAYFFTEDLRVNGAEDEKRATPNGYWKVYKGDAPIKYRDDVIGFKTKLRFHGADGLPTLFKMGEYRCMTAITQLHTIFRTKKYMICKVKNGGVCSSGGSTSGGGRKRSKQVK